MAGYISVEATAVEIILVGLSALLFMIPLGISFAASACIGSAIGENNVVKAKQYAKLIIKIGLTISFICITLLITFRRQIAEFYTEEKGIVELTASTIPFMSISFVVDALMGVSQGIVRGIGKQSIASIASAFAYYAIGIPSCYLLAFKADLGLKGIWLGMPIGLGTLCGLYALIIIKSDWHEIAR